MVADTPQHKKDDNMAAVMKPVTQVMIPVGYELVKQTDGSETIYSFVFNYKRHERWYSWRLDCIDAMWIDVRERATREARPDANREERNSLTYAVGYADGKAHTSRSVARVLALAGYTDYPIDPVSVVEKLLDLLTPTTKRVL